MQIKVKESRKKNEDFQFNSDKENWMNTRTYMDFASNASRFYIISIDANKDKAEMVLKDYVNSGLILVNDGPLMSMALMLPKWLAMDVSDDLTKAGIEHCVYKQKITIA